MSNFKAWADLAIDRMSARMLKEMEELRAVDPFSEPEEDEEWEKIQHKQESSGGDNDYWIARIDNPKRLEPYSAECEDLIELFQMTFQEGEAFKALWRKGQMRIGNGKPGDTLLRNSEKVFHFAGRMVAMEMGR